MSPLECKIFCVLPWYPKRFVPSQWKLLIQIVVALVSRHTNHCSSLCGSYIVLVLVALLASSSSYTTLYSPCSPTVNSTLYYTLPLVLYYYV